MLLNEIANEVGMTKRAIKYYEEKGLLSVNKSNNGYRDYSTNDVDTLKRISVYRKLGVSVKDIKSLLENNDKDVLVRIYNEKMRLNGKPGFLPSKGVLKEHWGGMEEAKFIATVEILKENEIAADGYWGCIWCSEACSPDDACCFYLTYGLNVWYGKDYTNDYDRVALAF